MSVDRAVSVTTVVAVVLLGTLSACGGGRTRPAPAVTAPAAPMLAPEAQRLYEAGRHTEIVSRLPPLETSSDPKLTYLAGLTFVRLQQTQAALDWFARLDREDRPASWRLVGRLARARLAGPREALDRAMAEATRFDQDPYVQFDLGLACLGVNRPEQAAAALARTIALDPAFAYAHYFAGLAADRLRRIDQLVTHFETFLRLAPDAPERQAVEALLRAARGGHDRVAATASGSRS